MEWKTEELGPIQRKRVSELMSKINFEHKQFIRLTRRFDGVSFHDDRSAFYSPFEALHRPEITEKLNALHEKHRGAVTKVNLPEVEKELGEIYAWAHVTPPIKDEREPEAVLRERHEVHQKQLEADRQKQAEFEAKATEIPAGKRGVVLEICFDNSDPMSDYFDRHHTIETYLLAFIPDGREDERTLRTILDQISALKEIPFEWHTEKYSMGHGNYLESKACPETRKHPYKEHNVTCHYEIRYRKTYGKPVRVIPHPEWFLGEVQGASNGSNGTETVVEITIRENKGMNGVEILFPSKPDRAVIDTLKSHGFRYSFKQGLWWKRNTPGLIENIEKALKGSSSCNPV